MIEFQQIEEMVRNDGKYCRGELGGCGECSEKTDIKHDADGRPIYAIRERGCKVKGDCLAVDRVWSEVLDEIDGLHSLSEFVYKETKHCDEAATELKDLMIERLILLKNEQRMPDGSKYDIEEYFHDVGLEVTNTRMKRYIAEYNEQLNEREG